MRKRLFYVALLPTLLLTGCTMISELPREEQVVANYEDDPQFTLSRKLVIAFLKNDSSSFVSLLPSETRKAFSEKEFASTRKAVTDSVGEPISFKYVTKLELEPLQPHIWKIRFERKGLLKTDETFHSELLFRVITGNTDKGPVITSFQFL